MKQGSSVVWGCVLLVIFSARAADSSLANAQKAQQQTGAEPAYKQASVPVEQRVRDLLSRMTLARKSATVGHVLRRNHTGRPALDDTHASPDAVFLPDKAAALWGNLGVGSVHDLYPTPVQSNAIQSWVMAHNRLGNSGALH